MAFFDERFRHFGGVLADAGQLGRIVDAVDQDLHRLSAKNKNGAVRYKRIVGNAYHASQTECWSVPPIIDRGRAARITEWKSARQRKRAQSSGEYISIAT
nr:hypothetical protein [Burkholderia ambifaria]